MRKMLLAAVAGTCVFGGAAIAGAVQAQTYVVQPPPLYAEPSYHYDAYGRRIYDPSFGPPVVAGAIVGPALAGAYGAVPFDRYGPDPNGMIAADGHRLKCKLQDDYDARFDRYMTHRVCW